MCLIDSHKHKSLCLTGGAKIQIRKIAITKKVMTYEKKGLVELN
jgi:hypothetical protein